MKKQNPKKRHHYIPVFYLNGFTNSNGYLYIYDKYNKPVFESSPEGIAYENHYFSFVNSEGERDSETLENAIKLLEDESARVLRKIHNYEKLSIDDRRTFSLFVSSMMVRVPNMRENMRKISGTLAKLHSVSISSHKESFMRQMKNYEKDTRKQMGPNYEELREFMNNPDNYDVSTNKQYGTAMALSQIEHISEIFFRMKWTFLKATRENKYITGDNPLSYFDPTCKPNSFYGVGLLNKNIEVALPLSKEICAFGTWRLKEGYLQAKNQYVKRLNKMTAISLVKFAFCHNKSDVIDKFIKKYKDKHPIITFG